MMYVGRGLGPDLAVNFAWKPYLRCRFQILIGESGKSGKSRLLSGTWQVVLGDRLLPDFPG